MKIKKIILNKNSIRTFEDKILIKKVEFAHKNKKENLKIFENLNLTIKKGEKISIMGHSGSGKSTLIDLILGFLKPDNGELTVDNINVKNFFSNNIISYCPQSIHIFNTSIEKNISLESQVDKIDINKIQKLKRICQLNTFFSKKKNDQNFFGEGGSKVSGGQKQRIGIARALYFKPKILILDESLNAIDIKTAKEIFQNIVKNYPKLTIILVTHSKVLANLSEKIYTLSNKKLRLSSE